MTTKQKILKTTILIVDDHQEILDFLVDDLEDSYNVVTARDGKQALDIVELEDIDMIISDVMMPVMDGFELCVCLKENPQYSHIPFILLTAKNSLESKIEGLEFGADAYVEKPFSPEFLQAQMSSLLRNRKKVSEYYNSSPSLPLDGLNTGKADQEFLRKLNKIILDHLSESTLCVDLLAEQMCMSRPTLYRRVKSLSDLSPNELINVTRLKRATQMLAEGRYKIYEIANNLGFSTPSHFTRNFQKQFGVSPKEFVQKN